MAEGTYEYECMRAELLGLDTPDYETFLANQKEKVKVEEEEIENELLKDAEHQSEECGKVAGGLNDINSILTITQKKLNSFKSVCGSLTNLLKIKVGQGNANETVGSNQEGNPEEQGNASATTNGCSANGTQNQENKPNSYQKAEAKSDLSKALDKNVDKLDSLIMQADNAQYSMAHQTKQMKGFLK